MESGVLASIIMFASDKDIQDFKIPDELKNFLIAVNDAMAELKVFRDGKHAKKALNNLKRIKPENKFEESVLNHVIEIVENIEELYGGGAE